MSPGVTEAGRPDVTPLRESSGVVVQLPLVLPAGVGLLAVIGVVAASAGVFHAGLVLALTVPCAILAWRHLPRARGSRLAAAVALVAAGGWALRVGLLAGQYVVVARDPGFLALAGLWLGEHPSTAVPVGLAGDVARAVPGVHASAEAYTQHGDVLLPQGTAMLPVLLGLTARLVGPDAALLTNAVVGAVGVLAVYALGREVLGSWWALVPTGVVALGLPLILLSRSPYTEPLSLALVCAGLAALVRALRDGDVRGCGAAGAVLGLVAVGRIDGALVVMATVVAMTVLVLVAGSAQARAVRRAQMQTACGLAVLVTVLGLVAVAVTSPAYLAQHTRYVVPLLAAVAGVVLAAVLLTREAVAGTVGAWLERSRPAVAAVATGIVAVGALLLVSRPAWWVARALEPGSAVSGAVGRQQLAEGLVLDPTRSYDEQTLQWLVWYYGLPVLVLGLVGAVLATLHAVRRRDDVLLALLVLLACAGLPYVLMVTITPDQIWAVRRLVPVTVPTVALLAAWVLRSVASRVGARGARTAVALLAVATTVSPVATWDGAERVVEQSGRLDEARAVCRALEDAGVERALWVHSSPFQYLATVRVVCDVETVQVFEAPSGALVDRVHAAWGDGAVAVMSFEREDLTSLGTPVPVQTTTVTTLERRLAGRPQGGTTTTSTVWLLVVGGR